MEIPPTQLEKLMAGDPETVAEAVEHVNAMADAFRALGQAFLAMQPILEAIRDAAQALDDLLWERYRAVGAPYGDTMEGRQRYFAEEMAFRRSVDEYQKQRAWRQALIELRSRFSQRS